MDLTHDICLAKIRSPCGWRPKLSFVSGFISWNLTPMSTPISLTLHCKKKKQQLLLLKETDTIPPLNIKCEAGTLIWRVHWKPQTQISKRTGLAGVSTELWGKNDYDTVILLLLKYFRGNQMVRLANFWLQSKIEKSFILCFTSMHPHVHVHTNIWNKNSENNATLRVLWYILI